jgi:glycogen(starch) synthase
MPSSYPPVLGGLQTVAHTLAQYLLRRGHEVQVVTNRYPRALPSREEVDGVPVQRWTFLTPDLSSLRRMRPNLFLASFYFWPRTSLKLARLMQRFRPDVVNVHFPDAQTPFVLWLRHRYRFRLILSLHGHEIERWFLDHTLPCIDHKEPLGYGPVCATGDPPSASRGLRSILRQADAVTACSRYLLDRAIYLEPAVAKKGYAIHNGIDPARFRVTTPYQHPRPYILAYGRLTYGKGFDLLLQAFARVKPLHPDLDLIIAGDGEERTSLEMLGSQLGLAGPVTFYGRANPQEVVSLLSGCEFAVIPSRQESFGIVALEAMATGKRVLATRVGGLAELLTEVARVQGSACLVPNENWPDRLMSRRRPWDTRPSVLLVQPTVEGLTTGLHRALDTRTHGLPGECGVREHVLENYCWDRVGYRYETVLTGYGT